MKILISLSVFLGVLAAVQSSFFKRGKCLYDPADGKLTVADESKQYVDAFGNVLEGDSIKCVCPPGYVVKGKDEYICYDYGWYPHRFAECVPRYWCDYRRAPSFGYVTPLPNYGQYGAYKIGTVITFICQHGYRLEGPNGGAPEKNDTCEGNGEWKINETPRCVKIECDPRDAPSNGFVVPPVKTVYEYGDMVEFDCDDKYRLVGEKRDQCGYDDEWEVNVTPTCKITCSSRNAPDQGSVDPDDFNYFWEDETVTFSCNDGYRLVGESVDTCQSDGSWLYSDPTCELITCSQRVAPGNGTLSGQNVPNLPTNVITFACNSGFDLEGYDTDTCGPDGQWEFDETPTCVLITCPLRMAPANGGVGPIYYPYLPGNEITFTCNSGYRLVGEPDDTCGSDGTWDNIENPPTCELIVCPPLNGPGNGFLKTKPEGLPHLPGTKAFYHCNEHYELREYPFNHCLEDGTWKRSVVPDCVPITYTCRFRNGPIYGMISDPNPIKYEYSVGDTITFACMSGYVLQGPAVDECLQYGNWKYGDVENKYPTCEPAVIY